MMLTPGDSFGDYKVIRLLGKGGMGAVFLLENAEGGQVAAKILDPAMAGEHEARKRFLREAELAIGVQHPNLVETYDVGEDPETGFCYILMEYAPNGSLADRIKAGPLAVNDAIRIVYQIASVLELARQRGIVHRDIKPGNILFGADGKPKLADLGIARGGIAGTETTTVTQTGMMIGTPAYMAPEQMLDAHHVDIRADIYSLGIVFYEMLVGRRPNADDTVVQLMAKAVAGEPIPDVRTMRPEVSAAVAELINLMCAMKTDERVQTPAEVATAISQIVHGHEVTIRRKASKSVARKRRRMLLRKILPLVLAAAGIAGFAVFAYFGRPVSVVRPPAEQPMADQVRSIGSNVPETKPMAPRPVVTREQTAPVAKRPAAEGRKPVETARREETPIVAGRASGASGGRSRSGVTDRRIRYAKVGDRNWFYSLEDGEAVLWRGNRGYNNETKPCVEPSPEGEIEIPSELDGHKVTVIGNLAFFRCCGITSVMIPEGVREIRGWAFLDCDSLVRVGIPATMESMKSGAFCSCRALRSIDIGKCPDVLGSTFWNCSSLEEVRVSSENPSYVSGGGILLARKSSTLVFHPRTRVTVDWPKNLREIGEGAFLNSKVRELDIPDSVEKIGKNAFFLCNSLERVGLGSGLREVGNSAFRFCSRLRELDFPKSLIRMEGSVADGCSALKRVVFRGDAPAVELARGSVMGKLPDSLEILVAPGTKGWNGPDSSDLPEKWPAGNFDDSRPIRHLGTQSDDPAHLDALSITVEAPAAYAREKAKLEEMLGKIVPALNGLMGGTLKTAGRRIVISDKCRGYSVSRDGNTLTLSPGTSGFPKQTMGVGERVAVFLSGLGRKESGHTEPCANAMDWYLSFRLRELLGSRFDGSEKFKGDLSGLGRNALRKDPDMTLYDLRGESQNRKARKLVGSEKSTFAKEKCFWMFEQMRARNGDAIAGFLKAWEREQAAGNLADPVSQDDVAALFSVAVGEDLFDWFASHGMPSSPDRTRVKAKFTGASTPEGWLDDLEIAKARAKASGKMILAAFEGSDWCGWCKKMEKDVYTQSDFMPRVTPRFVPVYIDKPRDRDLLSEKCRERNPELHGEYNIRGVPCVVILDAEGKEIGRVGGYKQDVDALMERVDALVGRAQDPSANVCTDGKRKRKTDGKTSTPAGMTDDFEAACEQAKKEKRRILLVFSGSDWCGFCKRLDDDVLSEKKFIRQVSRKYVPVYVDNPRDRSLLSAKAQDRNPGLIDRYSPNGYPTVVVTDTDGEELARFSGYGGGGSPAFMRRLEDSVKDAERERKRRR